MPSSLLSRKSTTYADTPVPRNMDELSSELMCCVDLVDKNVKVAL
jgi:hypothetical protein